MNSCNGRVLPVSPTCTGNSSIGDVRARSPSFHTFTLTVGLADGAVETVREINVVKDTAIKHGPSHNHPQTLIVNAPQTLQKEFRVPNGRLIIATYAAFGGGPLN
jgi:hypothetical protein